MNILYAQLPILVNDSSPEMLAVLLRWSNYARRKRDSDKSVTSCVTDIYIYWYTRARTPIHIRTHTQVKVLAFGRIIGKTRACLRKIHDCNISFVNFYTQNPLTIFISSLKNSDDHFYFNFF